MTSMPDIQNQPPGTRPVPGLWRGIAILGLTSVALLAVMVGYILLMLLELLPAPLRVFPMPDGVPYSYPVSGDPVADRASLVHAVRGFATVMAINSLVLLGLFAGFNRLLRGQQLRVFTGPGPALGRDLGTALLVLVPLFGGLTVWQIAQTRIDPAHWITAAPVAALVIVIALPLQTLAEEILFRGFLLRWLTRLTGKAEVASMVQAILFAVIHPGHVVPAFFLGYCAAILTRMRGNLGAAWGLHLVNNAAVLGVSFLPAAGGVLLPGHDAVSPLPPGLSGTILFGWVLVTLYHFGALGGAPARGRPA